MVLGLSGSEAVDYLCMDLECRNAASKASRGCFLWCFVIEGWVKYLIQALHFLILTDEIFPSS